MSVHVAGNGRTGGINLGPVDIQQHNEENGGKTWEVGREISEFAWSVLNLQGLLYIQPSSRAESIQRSVVCAAESLGTQA